MSGVAILYAADDLVCAGVLDWAGGADDESEAAEGDVDDARLAKPTAGLGEKRYAVYRPLRNASPKLFAVVSSLGRSQHHVHVAERRAAQLEHRAKALCASEGW